MKKIKFIAGSLLALALPLAVCAVGQSYDVAKAESSAATTIYGSIADNESVIEQVNDEEGWFIPVRDCSFTLNGITWTSNFGRTRVYGKDEDRSYFQLLTSAAGEENSILNYTEADNPEFYSLGQTMLNEDSGRAGHQISAMYSSPVTILEDVNIYYRGFDRGWAFVYFQALEDIYYDADEVPDGINESLLYAKGTWNRFTIANENVGFTANDYGSGSGVSGDWNEGVLNINGTKNWRFNYLKGHDVRIAIALDYWEVAQGEDAVDIGIYDVVVNSTNATAAYMNELASRAPNTENVSANICNWIAEDHNYFSNTLKSVQAQLDEEDLLVLAETAIEGEYTRYTNALDLLNYINVQAGLDTLASRSALIISANPSTLIVFVSVLVMVLGTSAFIVIKKRKAKLTK